MISFGNKRWLVSFGATVAIALVGATLSSACKPKGGKGTAAAAASGSASAKTGPELSAGCQEYIDRLCEKVGKQAPTCQEMTKSAELMSDAVCAAAKRDIKFTTDKLAEKRKSCDTLVTRLCGELGKTTETCKMVETHTKNFPPERCKMMLERYPEVLADLKRMEEANKPLSAEKQALIANGENVPSFGPADAKATLVEFSDFQCPFCSKGANTLTEIKKKYAGKVRVVFRQFPLSFHDKAHVAAEAALAANAQGKFWEFHDKMFANQSALDRAALEKYAAEVGLKVDVFKKALDDKTYAAPVDADMKLGTDVGVQGTPSMFLNGKKVQNPTDADSVAKMIDEALKG